MNKKVLSLCLMLIFQVSSFASLNDKGESGRFPFSPFSSLLQKSDSILEKKYLDVKKTFQAKEYSKSLKKGLDLLIEVREKENKKLEYLCNSLIGDIFRRINNQDKSISHYKEALKILEVEDVLYDKNNTLNKTNFSKKNEFSRLLLRIGGEFHRLRKKDSAKLYYNKIIKIKTLDKSTLLNQASAYSNLSGLFLEDSIYDTAKSHAQLAVNIYKKNNKKISESAALINLANIYLEQKKYKRAKEIYYEALYIIQEDKTSVAIKYKEDLYYNLAWTLYLLKDYTAYDFQEKSYDIKDSLRNQEMRTIIEDVYAKYQEEYKVELVKNQVALKKAEEKRTAWFFGLLSFLVLVSSGVILYNYKLRQNNLKLKLDQTELAQKSSLEKLKSESQVRILNATLDGKEAERKQIAETLHDSVSSLLSSANLHLQATRMQFNGDTPIEVDKTQKIIIEASQTIRDLSHTLVSSVLLKFGLKYAIKDMAEKYSNSQIQIDTDIKNVRRYHQGFEIKVNNITQEFVNNILKHSNASKAIVRMEDKEGKLVISIQDNGDGFDKKEIPKKDGLGINQIDARIQMMKGEFHIKSDSETGTKISIVLPILEKENVIRV